MTKTATEYEQALEQGDLETMARLLAQAEIDPALAAEIDQVETQDAWQVGMGLGGTAGGQA